MTKMWRFDNPVDSALRLWIVLLLFQVSSATSFLKDACNVSKINNVLFIPAYLAPITEGSTASLQIKLPFELTAKSKISVSSANDHIVTVRNINTTDEIQFLEYRTFTKHRDNFTNCGGYFYVGDKLETALEFDVFGVRLGKADLVITIIPNDSKPSLQTDTTITLGAHEPLEIPTTYPVVVLRDIGLDDQIFHIGIQVLLAIINFAFGCELDLSAVQSYLKRPLAPSIGFCSQFLFMPVLGIAITQVLRMAPTYSIGLISLACSPGGGASNAWTKLLGGDVNLSLTMTFLSLTLALGMMPLWMFVSTRLYLEPSDIQIPYLSIFQTLSVFVVPCFLGIILNKVKPQLARPVTKVIKPLSVVFLAWVLTFGTYVNLYMWRIMREVPLTIAAGILLPWCGFVFGLCLALVLQQGRERAIAISIETGIQNIGVPIVLLQRSFQQPEGDLAATLANSVGIFTPLPLFLILIVLTVKRSCARTKEEEKAREIESSDAKHDVESDDSSITLVSSANGIHVSDRTEDSCATPMTSLCEE